MAGIEMNYIPYKGTSQSLHDVITGRVPVMIDNLGSDPAAHPVLRADRRSASRPSEPSTVAARCAAGRRRRERLSGEFLERALGAGQDTARDRDQAEHRGQRHPAQAGRHRKVLRWSARSRSAARRRMSRSSSPKSACAGSRAVDVAKLQKIVTAISRRTPCRYKPYLSPTGRRRKTSAPIP